MRTIDQEGNPVESPDLELGRLVPERLLVAHHPEVPEREEIYHFDTDNPLETYDETDGAVVAKIIDQEYQSHEPAWDEYEDVMRYTPYTEEELAEIAARKAEAEEARRLAVEAAAEAAKKAAEREAFLVAAPERLVTAEADVSDVQDAVAELGVLAAGNELSIEDIMDAVAELGAIIESA